MTLQPKRSLRARSLSAPELPEVSIRKALRVSDSDSTELTNCYQKLQDYEPQTLKNRRELDRHGSVPPRLHLDPSSRSISSPSHPNTLNRVASSLQNDVGTTENESLGPFIHPGCGHTVHCRFCATDPSIPDGSRGSLSPFT